jgi:SAM-dependent methyltransferase
MAEARVDRYFAGGHLVIDLGCGDGSWIDSVRDRYEHAIGFDIAPIEESRTRPVNGWEFVRADLNAGIPLPDGCADAIHANQVIEHIASPLHLLAEAHRTLRPGGVFLATTPNIRYLRHVFRLIVGGEGPMTSGDALRTKATWDDGHIHFFTAKDLDWIAKTAGFSRVRTEALIALTGPGWGLRRALDRLRGQGLVKGFLTGNIMLIARK